MERMLSDRSLGRECPGLGDHNLAADNVAAQRAREGPKVRRRGRRHLERLPWWGASLALAQCRVLLAHRKAKPKAERTASAVIFH